VRTFPKEESVPRLAIHGLGKDDAEGMKDFLTLMLQHIGFGSDARVETYPSEVTSCDGSGAHHEYIEIISTKPSEIRQILAALKEINIDVEWRLIGGFIEADKMG
jgi:hypothetical protein